jgi:hypothetical protein
MARMRRVGGIACAALAVLAVLIGWLQPTPDITTGDARRFTERALTDIGVERVRVSEKVVAGRYTPKGGTKRIDVWETDATVAGGHIKLTVDQGRGEAVFVDDVAADGSRLLTDAQFTALGEVVTDPARSRRITRNVAGTIAGLLAACVAVLATAVVPRRLENES